MKKLQDKKQRELEFMRQHTLSDSDFKRLIAEKMERARSYSMIQQRKNSKEFA